jgi:hypothetical protein
MSPARVVLYLALASAATLAAAVHIDDAFTQQDLNAVVRRALEMMVRALARLPWVCVEVPKMATWQFWGVATRTRTRNVLAVPDAVWHWWS